MIVQKTRIIADVSREQAIIHFISTHVRELSDAQKIADEIEEIAYNYNVNLLIINFSRLQQMTSSFLGKLIMLNKSLKQAGITLRFCSMARQVARAYKICRLQKIIPLFRTEQKALSG